MQTNALGNRNYHQACEPFQLRLTYCLSDIISYGQWVLRTAAPYVCRSRLGFRSNESDGPQRFSQCFLAQRSTKSASQIDVKFDLTHTPRSSQESARVRFLSVANNHAERMNLARKNNPPLQFCSAGSVA